jgi:hypothetical protein
MQAFDGAGIQTFCDLGHRVMGLLETVEVVTISRQLTALPLAADSSWLWRATLSMPRVRRKWVCRR